jgi:hypothetical protein
MQIAAVAYDKLTPAVREKVDALIKLNPDYQSWVAGVPPQNAAKYAFVRAAVWADDIKLSGHGHTDRDDTPDGAHAGQNIGYSDTLMHKYWHYKDINFSPDGTPSPAPDPVDAVTQIKTFTAALAPSSGASDDIRSYDLVWLLHLVGDVHQPLHAVARYTRELPTGDAGGNSEMVIPATGETVALHAYWDAIFGGYTTPFGAIFDAGGRDGLATLKPNHELASISDPQMWLEDSAELAKKYAYAPPVSTGSNATLLTREYETSARNIARSQAALAAARLATLINDALK